VPHGAGVEAAAVDVRDVTRLTLLLAATVQGTFFLAGLQRSK
jgi:hypothetical protein